MLHHERRRPSPKPLWMLGSGLGELVQGFFRVQGVEAVPCRIASLCACSFQVWGRLLSAMRRRTLEPWQTFNDA